MDWAQRQQPREGRKGRRKRSIAQETSAIGTKSRNGKRCPLGVHLPELTRRTGGTGNVDSVDSAREKNKARTVVEIYRIPLKRGRYRWLNARFALHDAIKAAAHQVARLVGFHAVRQPMDLVAHAIKPENRERFIGDNGPMQSPITGDPSLTWSSFASTSQVRTAYL